MNPDARVGRTRLSAAAEVGVAFDFCVDLFIAWLDQDHHNLRPKAAGNSVRPTQPGDSRLRSLRSLLLPHPRRCFTRSAACPRMVYVSFWCLSASKVTRAWPPLPGGRRTFRIWHIGFSGFAERLFQHR